MWADRQVWLHGDATPANFLFGHGMDVAAIDLERMKRGDRMFDVGRVAGNSSTRSCVTPATGTARSRSSGTSSGSTAAISPAASRRSIRSAGRAPYYMALNLLRIARNDYIGQDYGRRLVTQAKRLMQAA